MTEPSLQTSAEKKMQTMSVADTIVQRIVDEGVAHCFGVAGDYLFPMCNAVESSPSVKWIGCANELNAAYAADGYARIRGAGMLATTYGVGELSALNGVMGAKAERSLVFHVVGMPSYQNQRLSKIAHHTLGDGHFGNFAGLSAAAACCSALINPDNCIIEMERVIGEARRNNQPAYILVPSDYALAPVTPGDVRRLTLRSSAAMLKKAVEVVTERLRGARSVIVLPAFTIARLGLQKEFREAIEALGFPFATMLMEKCIIDESHPQFAGLYAGAMSAQSTREIVEGADLVLDLGGVSLNDITTAAYSAKLDPARFITIGLNDVRMGEKVIGGVRLADMLVELGKLKLNTPPFRRTVESAPPISGKPSDKITMDALYPRYAAFVRAGDTVVLETGSSTLGLAPTLACRRRADRGAGPVGVDRVGYARSLWRCARRSRPAHNPHYRRGLAPIDGKRDRRHGAVRRQCHRLCSQQRGLSDRASLGGKSGLVLQRPRALAICGVAERAWMRRLVHGARHDARRTRRCDESRP